MNAWVKKHSMDKTNTRGPIVLSRYAMITASLEVLKKKNDYKNSYVCTHYT